MNLWGIFDICIFQAAGNLLAKEPVGSAFDAIIIPNKKIAVGIFSLSFPVRAQLENGRSHPCLTLNPVLWHRELGFDSVIRYWLFPDPCRNISVL